MLFSSLRSVLGHIRLQYEEGVVSAGQALEQGEDQSVQRNRRTLARIVGIEELSAKYPWMDHVDYRMFLEGFDAGEQWVNHNGDISKQTTTSPNG